MENRSKGPDDALSALILGSQYRRACLRALRAHGPDDAWLAAGFVRNAVFDRKFGAARVDMKPDLDVVYLDPQELSAARDKAFELALSARLPGAWSVTNQARMAVRHGHPAYRNLAHAISYFPEQATAVAVRLQATGTGLELLVMTNSPY